MRLGVIALILNKMLSVDAATRARLDSAISADVVLALVDHAEATTRICLVQILDCALRARLPLFIADIARGNGFNVLASQLAQHPLTEELAIACCDMFTGQEVAVKPAADDSRFTLASVSDAGALGLQGGAEEVKDDLGYPVYKAGQ